MKYYVNDGRSVIHGGKLFPAGEEFPAEALGLGKEHVKTLLNGDSLLDEGAYKKKFGPTEEELKTEAEEKVEAEAKADKKKTKAKAEEKTAADKKAKAEKEAKAKAETEKNTRGSKKEDKATKKAEAEKAAKVKDLEKLSKDDLLAMAKRFKIEVPAGAEVDDAEVAKIIELIIEAASKEK